MNSAVASTKDRGVVGNDGGSDASSDDFGGARVDRRDENGGGEGVVDSSGDC